MISSERQRWGRIAAGVVLTVVIAVLRGQLLLCGLALLVAVPVGLRLFTFVRVRRGGSWQWPTMSSSWPTGWLGRRGWLVAALGACVVGLLAAALHTPSELASVLAAVLGAALLIAPPMASPTNRAPAGRVPR